MCCMFYVILTSRVISSKVPVAFLLVFHRLLLHVKPIFQILRIYDKGFQRYSHFYISILPVLIQCFSLLAQAVMSQAENTETLKVGVDLLCYLD